LIVVLNAHHRADDDDDDTKHQDLVSFREPPVVIDVRSPEAFARARYPRSINVSPRVLEFSSLNAHRGKPIVVIAEKGDTGYQFANRYCSQCLIPFVTRSSSSPQSSS
jgi:rhodanese-related sulfurtransferase